jgi:hypothetical protein
MKLLELVILFYFILFIVILNELRVKCVIGFCKFVRIFEGDQWEW